ncbi:MAG: hypothetical protein ACLP59_14190 [Bryobacteraceae bacterium]
MSFLDNLESNLKNMESREERRGDHSRDARTRDSDRARAQASAAYAEQIRTGPYAAELMKQVTRMGYAMRTKVNLVRLGTTLRLEARGQKLELRPTPAGVVAVFVEQGVETRSVPVDMAGSPEPLAREWLGSLPPVPAAVAEQEDLE